MNAALARFDALLPRGSRRRSIVITCACVVAACVVGGAFLGGSPGGVVVGGLVAGCANALLATALILVFRSTGIINFAQAAMGGAGGYLCYALVQFVGVPFFVVLPAALVCGALAGFLMNAIFVQRFFNAPRLVLTVVTVVAARFIGQSQALVNALPGVGSAARGLKAIEAAREGTMRLPFRGLGFDVFPSRFGFPAIFTAVITAAVLCGLALFLRNSRLGSAVRGAAENPERAQSLGIDVRSISMIVWTVAGFVSGVAVLLRYVNEGGNAAAFSPELLIPALAAAVLARMASIPVAIVAAFVISVGEATLGWAHPDGVITHAVLLLVIAGGLLTQRRRGTRSEARADLSSWEATREIRPIPKELSSLGGVVRARRGLLVAALVIVSLFPFVTPSSQTNLASLIFVYAIVALSLVVLTGWTGQVSLGQFAFVAIAAVAASNLTSVHGLSFWLALPIVAVFTGALAAALGIPALRIRGAFLAVTTLSFAVVAQHGLFGSAVLQRLIPGRVRRPNLLFVSFASERSYYFLCLALLGLCALAVAQVRRSRPGRVLIGIRDNEAAVESFGIPLVRSQLAAFALSGALCGIAGVLFVHHQRAVDELSYASTASVDMFVLAMIGGITSVPGALLGAAYVGIANFVIPNAVFRTLATSGGLLVLLFIAPGGLSALASNARDAMLRIVATRRGIVVPSLFADMDARAVLARRAPLTEPIPFRGLAAMPAWRRYRQHSPRHDPGRVLAGHRGDA